MPITSRSFVKASIVYLCLGAVLGALLLVNRWVPLGSAIPLLRTSHIQMLVVGWLTQLILGVAWWLFPPLKIGLGKDSPLPIRRGQSQRGSEPLFWATFLFGGGALFSFFIVLPQMLTFFMSYAGPNLEPLPKLGKYLTFVARMVLAFGIAFEIPFLMFMATRGGLVAQNYFRKNRKYFYMAIVVLSFLLTAGELTATVLLSFPLFGLYEAGILSSRALPSKKKKEAEPEE